MIWGLKGKIRLIADNFVIIETMGGVLYKTSISAITKKVLPAINEEVEILTTLVVREDALDLYGFMTDGEKKLFDLLNTVSGVGPKAALSILSSGTLSEIRATIAEGKAELLTKSIGVGKKTAERIVLELKDKVVAELSDKVPVLDDDVYEALIKLGYPRESAKKAVSLIDKDITITKDRLREALKLIK